jgi:hypothetical protein
MAILESQLLVDRGARRSDQRFVDVDAVERALMPKDRVRHSGGKEVPVGESVTTVTLRRPALVAALGEGAALARLMFNRMAGTLACAFTTRVDRNTNAQHGIIVSVWPKF